MNKLRDLMKKLLVNLEKAPIVQKEKIDSQNQGLSWFIPYYLPGDITYIATEDIFLSQDIFLDYIFDIILKNKRKNILCYSTQYLAKDFTARIMVKDSEVDLDKIQSLDLTDNDLRNLGFSVQRLAGFKIFIEDSAIDLEKFRKLLEEGVEDEGFSIVFIDDVSSLVETGSYQSLFTELKSLANRLNLAIFMMGGILDGLNNRSFKHLDNILQIESSFKPEAEYSFSIIKSLRGKRGKYTKM